MDGFASFLAEAMAALTRTSGEPFTVGFVVTGPDEKGEWIVRFPRADVHPGGRERADVTITADATALMLLLRGGLVLTRAIDAGVVRIDGSIASLERFAAFLSLDG